MEEAAPHVSPAPGVDHVLSYTRSEAVGVAGLIAPWNLPLYLLTWKIAPCLAAGNTCVCKPSEFTSRTASLLADVLVGVSGLPAGAVNIVLGTGPVTGNAIVAHKDVPLISFTGGTFTARRILEAAAPTYKKVSLELGGKNPNVIFDDCDLDACLATTYKSSFVNQGEVCLCGSRIFVQSGVYEDFVKRFVDDVKTKIVGDPSSPQTSIGAVCSKPHMDKIKSYIQLAIDDGGDILAGGLDLPKDLPEKFSKGYFVQPTIVAGLPLSSGVMSEEIFGPVVTITKFETEEEVTQYANAVQYGLSASVWTNDLKRAHRMARNIRAGTVWINCWLVRDLRMPFGGQKASGIGREGGKHSMEFFTEAKTVCMSL